MSRKDHLVSSNDVFRGSARHAQTAAPLAGGADARRWLRRLRVPILIVALLLVLVGTRVCPQHAPRTTTSAARTP